MTIEEFFKTLKRQQAKELADEILQSGWYPKTVVYLKDPYNTGASLFSSEPREEWCKENCSKKWREYSYFYWLFESKEEALHFRMVWV